MVLLRQIELDPEKIRLSGQCFRWEKKDETTHRVLSADRCMYLLAGDNGWEIESRPEDEAYWKAYLDLDLDYSEIRDRVRKEEDPFLCKACASGRGIRILRQDAWEMIISFIISQNKNIPAICRSIEAMARRAGTRCTDIRGEEYYAFPTAGQIISLGAEGISACKTGYRTEYIRRAAQDVLSGRISLEDMRSMKYPDLMETLQSMYGVGEKVAGCIALFGFHHLNAFPVDTWIRQVLEREYPDGFAKERYAPYNGSYQQYLFWQIRKEKLDAPEKS